jgi:hypothetical protein
MASKYIQSREAALAMNPGDAERLSNFINEFGESLINIIENCTIRIQDVQTATDSTEFRQYQESLETAGFNQSEITQIEHTLFAKGLLGEALFVESNYQITKIIEEYTAINEGVVDFLVGLWNALTEDSSPIGILQFVLDLIGFIPASYVGFPIDVVADGLNAIIYMFRGRWLDAGISAIAAFLPGIGDVAKTVKYGKNAAKLEKAFESIIKTGKAEEKLIADLAQDSGAKVVLDGMSSVGSIMTKVFHGIVSGIGHILSTPPISWLTFGGSKWLGKKLISWVDEVITPIARNLETFGAATLKGGDDLAAVIKTGDISKIADNVDELIAAGKFGDVAQHLPFKQMLKRSEIAFTDAMKADPDLFRKAVDANYDKFKKALIDFRSSLKKPLEKAELDMLDNEMRLVYYEMESNKLFAKGLLKLDEAGGDVIAKYWSSAALGGKGVSLSGDIFKTLKNDPEQIKKFFGWVVSHPETVKALDAAGPGVTQLFRIFAKNPEVALKISEAGAEAVTKFAKLESELGDLGIALVRRRFNRNRLIIAKYLIGAPLRCPVNFMNKGVAVLSGNISKIFADGKKEDKKGFGQFNEGLKHIKYRYEFLSEAAKTEEEFKTSTERGAWSATIEQNTNVVAQTEELKKEVAVETKKVADKEITAILGPKSFNDICLSAQAQIIDSAAASKTITDTSGHNDSDRTKIQEISGATPMSATANDEMVNQTLNQVGVPETNNSSEGIFTEYNNSTDPNLIAEARLDADISAQGLWYYLAQIQNGELSYDGEVEGKISKLLTLYAGFYARVAKNASQLGSPSLYPNPVEVQYINRELSKLKNDPSYRPNFFGADVNPNVLFK